ncbi:MAG TPA: NAD(P)H-binding protein, partial [Acidimicrobiales bacterium]
MTSPILVTGGTGTLGRLVVARLRGAGHDVRVLSRHGHEGGEGIEYVTGDLAKGDGIEAATVGAEIIIHCAGSSKGDDDKARHLVQAASPTATRHLAYISVVGADRVPMVGRIDRAMFGYFGAKFRAERVVADSGLPWTTLRATQFHELILMAVRQIARPPVAPVPSGFRFQPVDAGEVAARLVELALAPPAGLAPDMGGPRVYPMADLVRGYLRASGKRRPILQVPVPGRAA